MKRKVKSALAYPSMLAVLTVGIVALMLVFVVPTFRSSLSSLNVEITGLTKVVYDISDFILLYWNIIILLLAALAGILYLFIRTKSGRKVIDILKIKLPIIGRIQTNLITARFASTYVPLRFL